jgi:hypothetical protein
VHIRPEVATLKRIYGGLVDRTGRRVFPGFAPGSESGWPEVLGTGPGTSDAFKFALGFFRDFVFEDADWDFHAFDAERDGAFTDRKLATTLNALDPDLGRFARRGGKLILYHGWNDPVVPAQRTIDYFRSVVGTMGAKAAGDVMRLFMVPGMDHCGGGPGPNDFGQGSSAGVDPDSSIAAALQRWVEQGQAPERIVATKH